MMCLFHLHFLMCGIFGLICICFHFHLLLEFLDNGCYPAGGGLVCQRSDTRRGDGTDEGNATSHTDVCVWQNNEINDHLHQI